MRSVLESVNSGNIWGFPVKRLQRKIGVTPKFCSDIELGLKGMSLPTLCKISKVLHLSTDLLFGEKPGETADQISLMLSQCSSKRRGYAEQILKIFLISDEE